MPRTEDQIQELVRRMYTTAESTDWDLNPEAIRSQRERRGVPLPDVKVLVLVAAAVILIVVGLIVANGSPSRRSTASGPTTTASTSTVGGTVSVPLGVGTQVANASQEMSAVGLQVSTSYVANNSPSGSVLSQNPAAGSKVSRGSAVTLVVSGGPSSIHVPTMIGLSQAQAGNVLSEAGLSVGTISESASSIVSVGVIISQNPAPGSSAAPGSSVDLVVSTGP